MTGLFQASRRPGGPYSGSARSGSARSGSVRSGSVRSGSWRALRVVGYGVAAGTAGAALSALVLLEQVRQARRDIPRAQHPPPRASGRYGARMSGRPLTMVMLGDSSAAGLGVEKRRQTPAALVATGISRRLRRPVDLHSLAVVGATSRRLAPQLEAALELRPDLAVIIVGGNDITHRTGPQEAVAHLAAAVRQLRELGTEVVVGTCPDLGTVRPIRRPLRWLARRWSRQLAAAQTVAVVEAGGWTVSLGALLGPRFAAEPHRMFAIDRFHPSADGYAAAAAVLLPTALAALGVLDPQALARSQGVRPLPQAAAEAAQHAGTEVSAPLGTERWRGLAAWGLVRSLVPRRTLYRRSGPDPAMPGPTLSPAET